jgi:hypothetical protein
MSAKLDIPFNLTLLDLTPAKLQHMRPVKSLLSFEGTGTNFHPDGLFSTEIFGRVGDELRNQRFSYIDIKVPILHPIVFRALVELKQLYAGIMAGTDYAIFDDSVGDFVRSDAMHGKTGYQFFIGNWKKIKYTDTKSVTREHNIRLVQKYADSAQTSKVVVLPAGLRDMEMGADGRPQENEVNTLYRKLIATSNTVSDVSLSHNPEVVNNTRYNLQRTFNDIYDTFEEMLQGKRKLVQNRWVARRIFNGTRNVITAASEKIPYLGAPGTFQFNDTGVGLYQTLKAILPVAKYMLRNGFLAKVFIAADQPARLVNKKTLKAEGVSLKPRLYDAWTTSEGIEKVITSFAQLDNRDKYVEIDGHYLGLIYKGPDNTFKLLQDIDEVPDGRSIKDVTPITFAELLYCSTYLNLNRYPLYVTRYPVTGIGSIYPSKVFCKTTIKAEVRRELGPNWEPLADSHIAYQFPIRGSSYVNSLIPHSARLQGLGADFDGDTCSGNAVYTEEAVDEVAGFLDSTRAYIGTNGQFMASVNTDTVALVLHNLTGV